MKIQTIVTDTLTLNRIWRVFSTIQPQVAVMRLCCIADTRLLHIVVVPAIGLLQLLHLEVVSADSLIHHHLEGLVSAAVKLLSGVMDEHPLVIQRRMTMNPNLVTLSSRHVTTTKHELEPRMHGLIKKSKLHGPVTLGGLLVRKVKKITSCQIGCLVL
jgi:hypothetical protein